MQRSNLIIVVSGAITSGGVRLGFGTQMTLSEGDARAMQREVPGILVASPGVRGTAQVIFGNVNWSTVIEGTTPDHLTARDWAVVRGRPFDQNDQDRAAKVALLGQTVATTLFGGADPIGQTIRIKKVPFTVVGYIWRHGGKHQLGLSILSIMVFFLSVWPLEIQRRIADNAIVSGSLSTIL